MKIKLVLATLACVSMSACGGGGSGPVGSDPVVAVSPPVVKPDINYRVALLPLWVGAYTGTPCKKFPAGEPVSANLTVSQAGLIEAQGVSTNLLDPNVTVLMFRGFDANGPISASYTSQEALPQNTVKTFLLGASDGSGSFGLMPIQDSPNTPSFGCENSSAAALLKTKSLYTAVAKYVDTPKMILTCLAADKTFSDFEYQLQGGQVKLKEETISVVNALAEESLIVTFKAGTLLYTSKSLGGGGVQTSLDPKGSILGVTFTSKSGAVLGCFPKK